MAPAPGGCDLTPKVALPKQAGFEAGCCVPAVSVLMVGTALWTGGGWYNRLSQNTAHASELPDSLFRYNIQTIVQSALAPVTEF